MGQTKMNYLIVTWQSKSSLFVQKAPMNKHFQKWKTIQSNVVWFLFSSSKFLNFITHLKVHGEFLFAWYEPEEGEDTWGFCLLPIKPPYNSWAPEYIFYSCLINTHNYSFLNLRLLILVNKHLITVVQVRMVSSPAPVKNKTTSTEW